jgi:quinoprotein dehydrogenase-associated probable ABC transporter substrate-binding protein
MSSDANKAWLTLVVLGISLTAMDYHMLTRPLPGGRHEGLTPISTAQAGETAGTQSPSLRVCADPNNLPFSNHRGEGFENDLALMIARELHRKLEYIWWPQRRGFIRQTIKSGKCDLVMGVPAHFELVDPTAPYYRSSYVFVTRSDRKLDLKGFDDPQLRRLTIGLHAIGDDYANVPPAQALATRGITENIRGYTIYGDYSRPDPPRELIDAVARGDVDVAIAWGPLAGYFAAREPVALTIAPVIDADTRDPAMQFAISAGVRHGDHALKSAVERVLATRRGEVDQVLRAFHVPLVPGQKEQT